MRYVLKRSLLAVVLIFGVALTVFTVAHLIPGDVVDVLTGSQGATLAQRTELRHLYGLDRPIYVQFFAWLGQLLHGDMGVSLMSGQSVGHEILVRFPVTMELTVLSLLLALIVGIPLGTLLAMRRNTGFDAATRTITLIGLSAPYFVTGILLILMASLYLPDLYVVGYIGLSQSIWGNLRGMLLPCISLAIPVAATMARMTRGAVLDEMHQEYVRVALAKGISRKRAIFRHVLRNALIPIVTQASFQVSFLLGSAVVIEEVFAMPGIGRLVFTAISKRDYPMLQGTVLVLAVTYVLLNLLTDLAYTWVDPRIRY